MKLPNVERAVVSIAKLRDYSLNPQHEAGKHKARVFKAALGLTAGDLKWLREKILMAVQSEEAIARPASPFGIHFVDILIEREGRKALVRTAWIIEYGTDFPRLTSCYVL
ncbi:MAG: hypothetical protein DMF67_06850 [Acidobacteria bacterium]|nr:MAG: hypothetical protein DMF67_06850 [Acidobacteriota bacterium]